MIRFFRKIRQELLKENRFTRYLIYAFGEILLVVIGILIALQANNWNEHRKTLLAIEETKNALIEELQGHMRDTERAMNAGNELAKVLDALRKKEYKHDMELNFGSFYGDFNLFDTFTFDLRQENLDKWIAFEKDLPDDSENLIWIAKQLKRVIMARKEWEERATALSTSRFKEFVDELPWYYDFDSISMQKREAYFENDPFFRNKAIHYLDFQLNENVAYTTRVRTMTLIFLWRMQEQALGSSPNDFRTLMGQYNFQPFQEIACNELPYERTEFIGFRNVFLLFNATNNAVPFQLAKPDGTLGRSMTIKPKGVFPLMLYPDDFLQFGSPCERLYSPVKNGYHIIE